MKRAAPILLALAGAVAAAPARNEQDDDFVDAMLLHHQGGIGMARLSMRERQSAWAR